MLEKKYSISDFDSYCKNQSLKFVFKTSKQEEGFASIAKLDMEFDDVITMLAFDRICFKNNFGTLCLNDVESIVLHQHNDKEYFSIVCKDSFGKESCYNFLISYTY